MTASTSLLPHQVMTGIGPSSDDVSWLNSEGDYLNDLSSSVGWVSIEIANAKANPQTGPSLNPPPPILAQLTNTASISRLKSDAVRLKTISSQMNNLRTQAASQAQQITSLQQQLATAGVTPQGSGGGLVKGGTPTKTTTTTTTAPASSLGTGTVVAGIATLAALGAGVWWYMEEQKKKQGLPPKRRP